MTDKVLVVDDDREIVRTVRAYLEQGGFEVTTAHDGRTALTAFRNECPDFIILDLMMPEVDGLDVAKEIRRDSQVPIIMLTARVEEVDRLIGLELGADDYVTKPFSPRELVARVKTVLRRTRGGPQRVNTLRAGSLVLDKDAHSITLEGEAVDLTPSEFTLLEMFMENAGRVMTRLQLIEKTRGYTYEGYERTVDAHVKNLRQKIESDPAKPERILTVYGVGYKFNGASDED